MAAVADSAWHLAQLNIARLVAPIDDPRVREFAEALDEINALAESSPGFVWRMVGDAANDATSIEVAPGDPLLISNMSVWESVDALHEFVYRSAHTTFLRRKREWFEHMRTYQCLWWVPAGSIPSLAEGLRRLAALEADGPTAVSFTFARRFAPPL